MARPPTPRRVPRATGSRVFLPAGVLPPATESVTLDLDALEALRLADLVGLYHEAAAARLGVSRATFGRLLAEARRRVAEALVNGKALRIGGGEIVECEAEPIPCPVHEGGRRRGRGCLCPGRGDARWVAGRQA